MGKSQEPTKTIMGTKLLYLFIFFQIIINLSDQSFHHCEIFNSLGLQAVGPNGYV